jgi:hypothetical protein
MRRTTTAIARKTQSTLTGIGMLSSQPFPDFLRSALRNRLDTKMRTAMNAITRSGNAQFGDFTAEGWPTCGR